MKCGVLVCKQEASIHYNEAFICPACYVTFKYLETSEYQLGDR